MEHEHGSDEWLMQRVVAGEREALSRLVRRYASPLLTFLRRMSGDHHRSEELFQETFLAVWASRDRYQPARPFRAWLFGIALNKVRAGFRLRALKPEIPADDSGAPTSALPSPVESAIATETATLVQTALLRLPTQQRSAVAMRIWNGLSYAEIAAASGCTEGAVRSNMFHGLQSIRKYLEPRLRD